MPNNITKALIVSSLIFSMTAAYADEPVNINKPAFTRAEIDYVKTDPDYFTIDPASIKISKIEVVEERDLSYLRSEKTSGRVSAVMIEQLINIASKIWDVIKQNAPVVDISTKYAAVLPQGITAWNQLAEWKRPKSYVYGFSVKNLYGIKTIDVQYKVMYTAGGKYKGKGSYLTGVTVIPAAVNVAWGYRFSLTAQVDDSTIANVGTDKDPIASLQLKTAWAINTALPLKNSSGANVYYMQGDGYFEELGGQASYRDVKMEDVKSATPLSMDPARIF